MKNCLPSSQLLLQIGQIKGFVSFVGERVQRYDQSLSWETRNHLENKTLKPTLVRIFLSYFLVKESHVNKR